MNQTEDEFSSPIDEVNDLFFGEDDRDNIDLSRGRPKKEVNDINNEPKAKRLSADEKKEVNTLIKQANFLKKFEDKLKKRADAEEKQKEQRLIKKETKIKLKDKIQKRSEKPFLGVSRYTSIGADHCIHDDVVKHMINGKITTECRHCSREKDWSMADWSNQVLTNKHTVSRMDNPDRSIFLMM